MTTVELERGQLWWVNFDPALGSEAAMTRPGLVVSNADHNEFMPTVTVCPLTSSVRRVYSFEVLILAGEGGLTRDSKAQPQLVRTVSKLRLRAYIGAVSGTTLALVDEGLKLHFGFQV